MLLGIGKGSRYPAELVAVFEGHVIDGIEGHGPQGFGKLGSDAVFFPGDLFFLLPDFFPEVAQEIVEVGGEVHELLVEVVFHGQGLDEVDVFVPEFFDLVAPDNGGNIHGDFELAPDPGYHLAVEALVLDVDNGGRPGVDLFLVGIETDIDDISDTENQAAVFQQERESGS